MQTNYTFPDAMAAALHSSWFRGTLTLNVASWSGNGDDSVRELGIGDDSTIDARDAHAGYVDNL